MNLKEVRMNTHQLHMESLVSYGKDGLKEINHYIKSFLEELEGENGVLNITQKIDGSPAVVVWHKFPGYPDDSICLKSFVSNANNCISSEDDINSKYEGREDMANKLKYCLQLAKYIPSGQAWQGDCLFTKEDLKEQEIKGKDYITFQPNKIVYAFSEDNDGYNKVKSADFGIAFHTVYSPQGDGEKKQSFNVDASKINAPDNFYIMSPALNVSKNKKDYNTDEIGTKFKDLVSIEKQLLSDNKYEELCSNKSFRTYWDLFENRSISDAKKTTIDVNSFFKDLSEFVNARLKKEYDSKVSKLKTDAGKNRAKETYDKSLVEMKDLLENNKDVLVNLVKALNLTAEIKMDLLKTFNLTKNDYSTFLRHRERGFEDTTGEGIAMSDQDGNIVKIVDRSTFSNANRDPNYLSGFEHESLDEDAGDLGDGIKNVLQGFIEESYSGLDEKFRNKYFLKGHFFKHCLAGKPKASRKQNVYYDFDNLEDYAERERVVSELVRSSNNVADLEDSKGLIGLLKKLFNGNSQIYFPESQGFKNDQGPVSIGINSSANDAVTNYSGDVVDFVVMNGKGETLTMYPLDINYLQTKLNNVISRFKPDANKLEFSESLNEGVGDTCVVGFGRLNPPTVAHELLVKTIADQNGDSYLYLSHSQDSTKNPLSYDKKLEYCKKSFGHMLTVQESDAKNMYAVLTELNQKYKNVIYVCGSDRAEEAQRMQAYNGKPNKKGEVIYNFDSMKFVTAGNDRINEDDLQIEQVSASKQRQFAIDNDLESFVKYCPSKLSDVDRENLFYDVRSGLGLVEDLHELNESPIEYGENVIEVNNNKFMCTPLKNGKCFMQANNERRPDQIRKLLNDQPFKFNGETISDYEVKEKMSSNGTPHGVIKFMYDGKQIEVEAKRGTRSGKGAESKAADDDSIEIASKITKLLEDEGLYNLEFIDTKSTGDLNNKLKADWTTLTSSKLNTSTRGLDLADVFYNFYDMKTDSTLSVPVSVKESATPSMINIGLGSKSSDEILNPIVSSKSSNFYKLAKKVLESQLELKPLLFDGISGYWSYIVDNPDFINKSAIKNLLVNSYGSDYYLAWLRNGSWDVTKVNELDVNDSDITIHDASLTPTTLYIQFNCHDVDYALSVRRRGGKTLTSEIRVNTKVGQRKGTRITDKYLENIL